MVGYKGTNTNVTIAQRKSSGIVNKPQNFKTARVRRCFWPAAL